MSENLPEMSEARTQAIRDQLADCIRNEPSLRQKRIKRRVMLWGSIGLLAAGATATGASVLLDAANVSDKSIVHCLSSASRGANGEYPGSSATIAEDFGPGYVEDAIALCEQMWEQGVLDPNVNPTAPVQDGINGIAPLLQVCVMRDGTAAVVPSDTPAVCQTIGLAPVEQ